MDIEINKSYCRKCGLQLQDLNAAFTKGCPSCGSKMFSFISDKLKDKLIQKQQLTNESLLTSDTAVTIEGKGKFVINLDALTRSSNENQPIVLQDQLGRINILLSQNSES